VITDSKDLYILSITAIIIEAAITAYNGLKLFAKRERK